MPRLTIAKGTKFGRLTVLYEGPKTPGDQRRRMVCLCDCGTRKMVRIQKLRSGNTRSCGCMEEENRKAGNMRTHGMSETAEFNIWEKIQDRCYNQNDKKYYRYGGRGITVCPAWRKSFMAFYSYVGPRPSPEHSIDRIDNDRGYWPGNVRWATRQEQCRNRRDNTWVEYYGKKRLLLELCEEFGVLPGTVRQRINSGTLVEQAFHAPYATPTRVLYLKNNSVPSRIPPQPERGSSSGSQVARKS